MPFCPILHPVRSYRNGSPGDIQKSGFTIIRAPGFVSTRRQIYSIKAIPSENVKILLKSQQKRSRREEANSRTRFWLKWSEMSHISMEMSFALFIHTFAALL